MQKGIFWLVALSYISGFLSPLTGYGLATSRVVQISHTHNHSSAHEHSPTHAHPHHDSAEEAQAFPLEAGAKSTVPAKESSEDASQSTHSHSICVAQCNPVWMEKSFSLLLKPKLKRIIHAFAPAVFTSVNLGAIFRPPIS